MSIDLTLDEQEKLNQFKAKWYKYGNFLLTVLLIIAAVAVAYQWWEHKKSQQSAEAASMYAAIQSMQQAKQPSAVISLADALMKQTPTSPYASRAALIAAAANVDQHHTPQAQTDLQWVLDHSQESGMQSIARLHLAGILLDQHRAADAIKLLDAPHDESDADQYSDLKGDALTILGQRAAARAAYQIALEKLPADQPYRQIIEVKLNAIVGVAAK